jgi:hypothetical protein
MNAEMVAHFCGTRFQNLNLSAMTSGFGDGWSLRACRSDQNMGPLLYHFISGFMGLLVPSVISAMNKACPDERNECCHTFLILHIIDFKLGLHNNISAV